MTRLRRAAVVGIVMVLLASGLLVARSAESSSATPTPTTFVITRPVQAAGWIVDGWGGLHLFSTSGTVAAVNGAPYWPRWDIARGVTASSVVRGWGLIVDGWGGLHPYAIGGGTVPTVSVTGYWRGWDIARGVAMLPDGSGGFVVDGWGGLHPFATATHTLPVATGAPYWYGQDIARGVAILSSGTGGYVLDACGGLHPFAIGTNPAPPALPSGPCTTGPPLPAPVCTGFVRLSAAAINPSCWPDTSLLRGIGLLQDGSGGYNVDGTGVLIAFNTGSMSAVPALPSNGANWADWDIARGIAIASTAPTP